jgi:phospholipase/carboxylesterase
LAQSPAFLERTVGEQPRMVVIWLHGLGADGHDLEPLVDELQLAKAVRFVFPHAPLRPVTINAGLRMRAWYDVLGVEASAPEDEAGIRASAAAVVGLIDRELARGHASRDIVLAGFSQGGALALHAGLRERRPLGGVLVLSGYLPLAGSLSRERSEANRNVPLFMGHGTLDPVVPVSLGQASKARLEAQGYAVEWHTYATGHSVCAEEITDVGRWLDARCNS